MKKIVSLAIASAMLLLAMTGCSTSAPASSATGTESSTPAADFNAGHEISIISREDGSGTRGAFIELFGIEEKDADGNKVDKTTEEATITDKTSVMLTTVSGNEYAIGYVSLGSLNDTVKALKVDGAEATAENIKAGTYKISRPFNIATKGEATGLAKDFIDYIMSAEGQAIVNDNGYISVVDNAAAFAGTKPEGKILVSGSSSVTPVMQKLAEAYMKINTGATVDVQQTDSSNGMKDTIAGNCDIGMASRELKESEAAELNSLSIAIDGVAVIVNPANPLDSITSEQVKSIYTGESTVWDAIVK
ncbi:MAG: extracellular solute-binding protein [Firmicutes bacterium]|nr:extracellular solute-binding protein [Bacillota bacterium]